VSAKKVILPNIGEVSLVKRRNSKNIRLTITATRTVRISMPMWVPYAAGASFAVKKRDWIIKQLNSIPVNTELRSGQKIGKNYLLKFIGGPKTTSRLRGNNILIYTNLPVDTPAVQVAATKACERALRKESQELLIPRLHSLADKYGYDFKEAKIKKLRSRWGSCSSRGEIVLSYYLIQLPWQFIDYVIIHELAHTKHHNHSPDFWQTVQNTIPDAKYFRRQIKQFRPSLQTGVI